MDLEDAVLSKISLAQKDKCWMTSSWEIRSMDIESLGAGEEVESDYLMGTEFWFCKMRKFWRGMVVWSH
jgi:hypothetical protein